MFLDFAASAPPYLRIGTDCDMASDQDKRVKLGISFCLLGERVRYDGGHKRDAFLVDPFGKCVNWVPVCPEVEMGLATPRDKLRLIDQEGETRLYCPNTDTDHTSDMRRFARRRIREILKEGISGFVFKKNSPSCGAHGVRIYRNGSPGRRGSGLFAQEFLRMAPTLPVEEEGRLNDPKLREHFVSRVFAHHRWLELQSGRLTRHALMEFHAAHKFLLMAHSQQGLRRLGRMLGQAAKSSTTSRLAREYWMEFSKVMRRPPTRRSHSNVLDHLAGYVSDGLDAADRRELTTSITRYRMGQLPLIVPVTLIRHYVRKFRIDYLEDQVYLTRHPDELMLLNWL